MKKIFLPFFPLLSFSQNFKIGLIIFVTILFTTEAFASHAAGMDISYECISQGGSSDTYKFTLKFYRDCSGVDAPGNGVNPLMNLNYSSSCGSGSDTLYQVGSVVDINPICSSYCNGGNSFGIEQFTYEATINLPHCSDWIFTVCENSRNVGINTIVNPGGSLCVEATINNTSYCNNSPTFTQYPTPFICAGNLYCYNNGAIEIDGDSLVYSLITPLNSGIGGTVNFIAPYSSTNPVGGGSSFDPITGNLCITPTSILSGILAIKVKEYRNGVLIGSIIRDIQINVFNCGTIIPPTLSEIDSYTIVDINDINSYTVELCTDGLENINFDINTINLQPPPPPSSDITITIDTQNYGDEISWDITSLGTVVAFGDNYANYNSYSITVCVPIGSLIFNIYDSYGNGWSGGTYSITGNPTLTGTTSGTLPGGFSGSDNFAISGGTACIPNVNQGALVTMSWNNGITGATYTITNNNSLNPTGTFNWTPSIADIAGSPYYFTVNVTNSACPTPGNFSFQYQIILNSFNDTSSQITTEIECISYLWPITNTVYTNSGTYIQASSSANGCNHLDSLILTINNPTASYDTVSECNSYSWNGITFNTSGDYNFNLINSKGCDSIANLNLTISNSTSSSFSISKCDSYFWEGISYTMSGTYIRTLNTINSCDSIVTLSLIIISGGFEITTNINITDVDCFGMNNGAINLYPSGGISPLTFSWDNAATTQNINSLTAGNYSFTITDSIGCTLDSTVSVSEPDKLIASFQANNEICRNDSISILIELTNPTYNYYTVQFYDSIQKSFIIDSSGVLIPEGIPFYIIPNFSNQIQLISVTDNNGCTSDINQPLDIIVNEFPILEINQDDICIGTPSFTLNEATPEGGDYFIDGQNTNFFDVENLENGAYTIRYEYTDIITNCSNSIEKIININPSPIADFSFSPQPADIDNPTILFVNESENIVNTKWILGDGTTLTDELEFWHTYADTGTYNVTYAVRNQFNCSDTAKATLIINPVYQIFIPSAFTPNNDGDNDNFKIEIIGQKEYKMIIFNKWGGVIFEEKNGIWNGKLKNNVVQNGTYSYTILVSDFNGRERTYQGSLMLIR